MVTRFISPFRRTFKYADNYETFGIDKLNANFKKGVYSESEIFFSIYM